MSDAAIIAAIDRLPRRQLVSLLGHIANRLALEEPTGEPQDELLSVKQLAARVPFSEGTLRNLVWSGELVEGEHFYKRGGRVIYSWIGFRSWLTTQGKKKQDAPKAEPYVAPHHRRSA